MRSSQQCIGLGCSEIEELGDVWKLKLLKDSSSNNFPLECDSWQMYSVIKLT